MVKRCDNVAEESRGHWVSITHGNTLLCLLQGNRPLAMSPDPQVVAQAVLASIPRVYVVWYVVVPAPGNPWLLPEHQYPHTGADATAQAWLATRDLVWAAGRLSHALT